jgi:hypothetical protein
MTIETGSLTPEEREGFQAFLASGASVQPYSLTPAPPGPNPGQPGHFAHHNWLEASVKSLALPAQVTTYTSTGIAITTAPAPVNCDATILNPDPTRTLTCLVWGQSQMTVSAGITAGLNSTVDGATTLALGTRGEEGRCAVGGGTMTLAFVRQISLNPGTSRVRLCGGIVSGSGSQSFSFNKITVLPVGYV